MAVLKYPITIVTPRDKNENNWRGVGIINFDAMQKPNPIYNLQ